MVVNLVVKCLNYRHKVSIPLLDLHLRNVRPMPFAKSKKARDIYILTSSEGSLTSWSLYRNGLKIRISEYCSHGSHIVTICNLKLMNALMMAYVISESLQSIE